MTAVDALERTEKYHVDITHPDNVLPNVKVDISWKSGQNTFQETRNYPSVGELQSAINEERFVRRLELVSGTVVMTIGLFLSIDGFFSYIPEFSAHLGEMDVTVPVRVAEVISGISSTAVGLRATAHAEEGFQKLNAIKNKISHSFLRLSATPPEALIQP